MLFRASLASAVAASTLLAAPAYAAGVGFSLPKFRALTVGDAAGTSTSVGGSVQVVGTTFSVGMVQCDLGFDYAYTRDFSRADNYSFFDLALGLGVPLRLGPQFYLTPAIDAHTLLWVASPQSLESPTFAGAPRLTVGFMPSHQIKVELSLSQAFLLGVRGQGRSYGGGMTIVELGGSYSF